MDKFIVSARKYRPQTFSTVVGQKHITTTLRNAILQDTLAHAFLFCGPRGVGKTTCARILAKTINCDNLQPDGEACNECVSCRSFNEGNSLNIHELDAASNNSVEDIRELVTQVRFAPQEGKYKIYIIDEVHMLSASAFNAFLKTLEEPPSYAKFILATTEKHKILPTILSRCQIFDFKRITTADTVEHLEEIAGKEHISAEKAALQLIAQKSEGCMRDALSLLDKIVSFTGGEVNYANTIEHLNVLDEDVYFRLLDALLKQDVASALLVYDEVNRKGFEGDTLLTGFAEVLRNLMVSKDAKAAMLLDVLEGMQERYAKTAASINMSFLASALHVISESEAGYRMARNKRLFVEIVLIRLCYLQQAIELAVTPQGQVVQKRRVDTPVAVREKQVPPVLLKNKPTGEAALRIATAPTEIPQAVATVPTSAPPPTQSDSGPAERPPVTQPAAAPAASAAESVTSSPRKGSLLKQLQEKVAAKGQERVEREARLPEASEVKQIWDAYAAELKEAQKHHATTSFQLAQLSISENTIKVACTSSLNQKIIEAEATELLTRLKQHFHNHQIQLVCELQEDASGAGKEVPLKYLNSSERLRIMASEYPQVAELKNRLKLDLDY